MISKEICLIYLSCIFQNIFVESRFIPERDLQYSDDGSRMSQKDIRKLLLHMHDSGQTFKILSRRSNPAVMKPAPLPIPGQKYQLPITKYQRIPHIKAKLALKLRQGPSGRQEEQVQPGNDHVPSANQPLPPVDDKKIESMVEKELKQAASGRSLLQEEVYIEKKGYNDFLVLGRESDRFIEYVPNSIYYATEKKCANWLTNCNQKGLQNVLLHKITGPYPYRGT